MTANENEATKNERGEIGDELGVNPSELQNAPRVSVRTVRLSDRYVCDLVLRGLNYGR